MLNLAEFAAAQSNSRVTFEPVEGTITFNDLRIPPESPSERIEEGDVLEFPPTLEKRMLQGQLGGHVLKAVQIALWHQGAIQPVDYLWFPQTWLKVYRKLRDNGTTSPDVVRWGGDAVATYVDIVRKQGYDAAVHSLLSRKFKAENCREFPTRGYDHVRIARVFDMVEVAQQPQQP